ncbi:DnaJ subfamily C member 9 [Cryptotermes secundus]|uniref:DnaJ subfamily C member 9 n=1 Tax=Cryptotermes secundus TaxID=105785 RepID=A0A2J7QDJ2_9NEOP|nr:dnaJ homolog subfamily C member 9 [Cryptotermes secundus]PNF26651.1 DnaJ subfamily C member 9 [Cryptotermes secundus]
MPSLHDLCEKYFQSRDLYEVLKIPNIANQKQVRKAYHKLSLLVHPDRVEEKEKIEATEKFKVLGKIHSILSDKEKRAIYDESGDCDEENDDIVERDWNEYWRMLFKPITVKDITDYEKKYKGSEEELGDLKRAYLDGKGDMDFILEAVPFSHTDEEPRLRELIQGLIDKGDVPEHKAFTDETPRKRERRKRKWEKEAQEAAKLKQEKDDVDLSMLIQKKQQQRATEMNSFFDMLTEKYGGKSAGKKTSKKKK